MKQGLFTYLLIFILIGILLVGSSMLVLAKDNEKDSSENEIQSETRETDNKDISNLNLDIFEVEETPVVLLKDLAEEYDLSLFFNSSKKRVWIYNKKEIISFSTGEDTDSGVFEDIDQEYFTVIKDDRTYVEVEMITPILEELGLEVPKVVTDINLENDNIIKIGEEKAAELQVYNISRDTITLEYGSGQLFDLWIYEEESEEELWLWSEGKFFTMALQSRELEPGEKIGDELDILIEKEETDIEPGDYYLTGEVATREPLNLEKVEIEITE